ncbi:Formate dehydrogenase [Thermosinus carboxydivorans Nor1]|uniref:Formate dehydrogenase n=1 Tax=Thermosinus carboxydivorans Nor1 TaxID=401526 RepID=A1HP11_9FIRM|nr:molybdopterin oxidoreductase family protein [Thermosinus carboxydivorans]EAX48119.1 Formate dehydrogenase [Thermosinus carboxydivorans Nor1]
MAIEKRSVCPYDCPDACGLLVKVASGKVTGVRGDPDHPFTRGSLCPKMAHYERTVYAPGRLTRPLLRTGPKGAGQFKPVSWDEAIKIIVERWQKIIAENGGEAILPCSYAGTMGLVQRNAGHAFFYRLGASRLDRTLCTPAKDYGWKAVMGGTLAPHPDEAAASDLIILWGLNALATNIHFLHAVRRAKRQGAAVWLIDTYANPTAKIADRVFLVHPGSDAALAVAMAHVLVRDGLVDQAFIDRHVQGYEEYKREILPDYTPTAASKLTGLPAEVIEEMALAYGRAAAPFISVGGGLARYGNGAMTVRAIVTLPALTGAWQKRGGGVLVGVATGSALNVSLVTREDLMDERTRIININQIGDALNDLTDPPIKSLYVYHSNPAAVLPDQNRVIQGLLREDLFTVVHERFLTDTARYADIVLPATTSLEHSDIYRAYGHYCLQRAFPVIAPVGEAKSNWEVFCLLAQAMGFTDEIFRRTTDELIEEMLAHPTPWLEGVDMARLKAGLPVELPLPADYKLDFKTPSGKIEIYNPRDAEPLPRYLPPHGDEAPFWLMTAPSLYGLNSSFNERADLIRRRQRMSLLMNPDDATGKGLRDGQRVIAFNRRGEVAFYLAVSPAVPPGVVVAEGVWWLDYALNGRTVNALTSQRLTDRAGGSTFYDTKVDVRAE